MDDKSVLPPYTPFAQHSGNSSSTKAGLLRCRRRRLLKLVALASVGFIAILTWLHNNSQLRSVAQPALFPDKLAQDLQTCRDLHRKPTDPIGLGRDANVRTIPGTKPTLVRNATIWTGEPDVHDGRWRWIAGDVLLDKGLVQAVAPHIEQSSLPADTQVYDAGGRKLTAGIIDMHSHVGVFSLPALLGNTDFNEMASNVAPWARALDALNPLDPQLEVVKSGGVTTSLVLPGSSNNMGGEAFVIKHATGNETGVKRMLADPDQSWRYLKMACGENPRFQRFGISDKRPFSRMGESFIFRKAFQEAARYVQRQDEWCARADSAGVDGVEGRLEQDVEWESLGALLRGQAHLNVHCYTALDMESMVDHSNEFEFPIRAFHHAQQAYLIPEVLKRAWGGRPPSLAIFADNMYYKAESYTASEFAGSRLYHNGLTPIYVSDHPATNSQHVAFEAAKGFHYGLPYHVALASVTTAAAEELGFGQRLGKVKSGYDADLVIWDSDPLSVGATPVQVWIDGTAQFAEPHQLEKKGAAGAAAATNIQDNQPGPIIEEPTEVPDAFFSGIRTVLLAGYDPIEDDAAINLAISNGEISCIGACDAELKAAKAAGHNITSLQNGYLTNSFTAMGGTLGLNEIDGEPLTDNGANPGKFTRAVDGLRLGGRKLEAATRYGVTKAISAPTLNVAQTHHGTSVAFLASGTNEQGSSAILESDMSVHYTFTLSAAGQDVFPSPGGGSGPNSFSAMFGDLRDKLMDALDDEMGLAVPPRQFSEKAVLRQVIRGEKVLVLTINSADAISAALRIKNEVESFMQVETQKQATKSNSKLRMAIYGGAESHLVANQLAAASVGIILSPFQGLPMTWDSRRVLSGAPLTNGTALDWLVDAGVKVGIGLSEDWRLRDLGFEAGAAYRNSNGRLSEQQALDLVGVNIHDILGNASTQRLRPQSHFIVSEGSPLEVGHRVKAVGTGAGAVLTFV